MFGCAVILLRGLIPTFPPPVYCVWQSDNGRWTAACVLSSLAVHQTARQTAFSRFACLCRECVQPRVCFCAEWTAMETSSLTQCYLSFSGPTGSLSVKLTVLVCGVAPANVVTDQTKGLPVDAHARTQRALEKKRWLQMHVRGFRFSFWIET